MRRWICFVMLICLAGMVQTSGAAEITIKWGDVLAADHPSVMMIEKVAQIAAEKSNGRIEIQSYPGGQLGGSRDMIEAVSMGTQDMVTEGAANFGQWVPSIGIVEAPYIWRGIEHLLQVMDGPIGQDMNQQLIEKRGMRILGTTYYGVRNVTTTDKEIHTVADMKDFKIRVPENEIFLAMARAWGAKPTPMNFNELYLALRQKVVDGQENPSPTIDSAKFYEVQKYLILTGHIITPRLVVINEALWQKLSEDDQKILQEAVKEGISYNNAEILQREKDLLAKFEQEGMTIITPEIEEFRKAVLDSVPAMFEEKWGKGLWEQIQNVK
ncbi:putative C4-dicarboxylate ABC transporter substrate binding protein [Candidatus Vecturithrix granuli]|uniref:Putative C4-dicarboxylate ABC transporter substrate binding protein n=1 Tax=Vecturithrix granuli TaxID=1499967 RepID=A0A081BZV5_VECG1|nr:putative C4-dicarboxylate ABC transporter substrate binding protein [Candidatus Vecturithrix granuli]